jgi:hypothetical protein
MLGSMNERDAASEVAGSVGGELFHRGDELGV